MGVSMRKFASTALLAIALVMGGTTTSSAVSGPTTQAEDPVVTPLHDVVCSISIDPPSMITGSAVGAYGRVRCNASPDVAITSIQLQIYRNGKWSNFGTGVDQATTQPNFGFSDTAGAAAGCFYYRAQMVREAFHGTWDTSSATSGEQRLCS
ncbi:hypothetical protein EQW78_10660 [Oerskovia turbata]|uniref:Secreted protein n=1 Tax=Oerskovia turbata TaxID=1713 RepID=A0A4Q1KWV9_9CELL|nr:hypothetical protein [Oerskovia turbata]RXR23776.1 hypothetical protein EQW73_14240 [Oerskovia turbata]RXR33754.1 hypothetical protein EQW78_10660 [Oerskovia turbata]